MPQSRKSRHVPGGGGGGGYDGNNNNNNANNANNANGNNANNANGNNANNANGNNMNINEPLVQQHAVPPNPQPLWAGIQIPQFNPQPAAGLGAALAAQGNANHIPPPLIIPNPPNFNFGNPNPQGRKRKHKSRKHKSRKNKSRKHKSNRR